MYDLISLNGLWFLFLWWLFFFAEGDILGDATVSGCPSSSMEKVILTADTQHMEAISRDWKPVVWSLLAAACIHIENIWMYHIFTEDTQHTNNSVCLSEWV